jgi:probable F420-dependent oxidoreductase
MKFDVSIAPESIDEVPHLAQAAEALGFDTIWTSETKHDPFLPLAAVAGSTRRAHFGTAIAVAFARSPTVLAHTSWDLANASGGRFILGLGTQVKPHIERRFGMTWPESPVGKMRDMIESIRAVWRAWQSGERLNYRGETFKLGLMTPFFNPGPISHPDIPIFIAGVNPGLCRLAGELAEGLHAHPYHSVRYLKEVVLSSIREGTRAVGRDPAEIELSVTVMTAENASQAGFVRSQIAFYASTPSYRPVMALHGWGEVADRLSGLARRQAWDEMAGLINDEILETFAVVAPSDRLGPALRSRYAGLADRVTLYAPFDLSDRAGFWAEVLAGFRESR